MFSEPQGRRLLWVAVALVFGIVSTVWFSCSVPDSSNASDGLRPPRPVALPGGG